MIDSRTGKEITLETLSEMDFLDYGKLYRANLIKDDEHLETSYEFYQRMIDGQSGDFQVTAFNLLLIYLDKICKNPHIEDDELRKEREIRNKEIELETKKADFKKEKKSFSKDLKYLEYLKEKTERMEIFMDMLCHCGYGDHKEKIEDFLKDEKKRKKQFFDK